MTIALVTLVAVGSGFAGAVLCRAQEPRATANRVYRIGVVTESPPDPNDPSSRPWPALEASLATNEPSDASFHIRLQSNNAGDPADGLHKGEWHAEERIRNAAYGMPIDGDPSGTRYTATLTVFDAAGRQTDQAVLWWVKP